MGAERRAGADSNTKSLARFRWVLIVALAVSSSACAQSRKIGVQHQADAGELTFFIPLCGDERVTEVSITEAAGGPGQPNGPVLWSVRAVGDPQAIQQISMGTVPPRGFDVFVSRTLDSLIRDHGGDVLAVTAESTGGTSQSVFEFGELSTGGLTDFSQSGPQDVSAGEVSGVLEDQCSPATASGLFWTVTVLVTGIVVAVGAVIYVLILIRLRRQRIVPS